MDRNEALAFVKQNPRAVMATTRSNGSVQLSPVTVGTDDDEHVIVSTRETAYKTKNLRRDPSVSLCVFTSKFFGEWVQVDGTAELISLPAAMDLLVDYYRRLSGEHPDWDDYRAAMERDQRLIVRITIDRAGPDRSG